MVDHNAAKFVSNIYPKRGKFEQFSIHKILNDLNWKSLEYRRKQSRLIMTYKIINDHLILDSKSMPKAEYQRPNRKCNEMKVGYENQLVEPPWNTDVVKNTFFFAAPHLWNTFVSATQANAPSVDAFKEHLKKQKWLLRTQLIVIFKRYCFIYYFTYVHIFICELVPCISIILYQ